MAKRDSIPLTKAVPLTARSIADQDNGVAEHLINAEIDKALNDLADRGEEDGKPRKVKIELEIAYHNGLPYTNVAAQAVLPARRTKNTGGKMRMKSQDQHEMLFQAYNADNADQPVFDTDGEIPNE